MLPSSPARSLRREPPADPRGSQLQCWPTEASSSKLRDNLHRDLCRPELMFEAPLQQIPCVKSVRSNLLNFAVCERRTDIFHFIIIH